MKKGCFITTIVVATVIIGAALYIFQNHFDSLILNPGKKILAGFVKKDLEKKLEFVVETPEKAELRSLIKKYSENTDAIKKLKEKDVEQLISTIESAISDSIIKISEFEEISQLIKLKSK